MKLKQIVGLDSTYTLLATGQLPIKTSYKLNRLYLDYEQDMKFYKEQYQKILQDNATKDDDGNIKYNGSELTIPPENFMLTAQLLEELGNIDIADSLIEFNIDEFEGSTITPAQMLPLMPFIK